MESCLYDVYDVVKEAREELCSLQNATFSFSRIVANYQYYHNNDSQSIGLVRSLNYNAGEDLSSEDSLKLHTEIFELYNAFSEILDAEEYEILDVELDERTGVLLVTFG